MDNETLLLQTAKLRSLDEKLPAPVNGRLPVDVGQAAASSYKHINANGTIEIKKGPGVLHAVVVNAPTAGNVLTIMDGPNVIGVIKGGPYISPTFAYHIGFKAGLTVVSAGGAPPDLTVTFD